MNLILIDRHELVNNMVTLTDHRSDHIRNILNSQLGDSLRVGLVNGRTGTGRLEEIEKKHVRLSVDLNGPMPSRPETDLILALPRPIMLKRVLAQAAALGVGQIFITNANRVEKSFFNASLLREKKYNSFLVQGLEQSMDTIVPKVSIFNRFRPFVEDHLAKIVNNYPFRLIAHPNTAKNLWQRATPPVRGKMILAIGPEGGWIDFEIKKFEEQGFKSFSLGSRILRVDTAVPAILAQTSLLRQVG